MIAKDTLYLLDKQNNLWAVNIRTNYNIKFQVIKDRGNLAPKKVASRVHSFGVDSSSDSVYYLKDGIFEPASIFRDDHQIARTQSGQVNLVMEYMTVCDKHLAVVGRFDVPRAQGRMVVETMDTEGNNSKVIYFNSSVEYKEFLQDITSFKSGEVWFIVILHKFVFVDVLASINDGSDFMHIQSPMLGQPSQRYPICDFTVVYGSGELSDKATFFVLAKQRVFRLVF